MCTIRITGHSAAACATVTVSGTVTPTPDSMSASASFMCTQNPPHWEIVTGSAVNPPAGADWAFQFTPSTIPAGHPHNVCLFVSATCGMDQTSEPDSFDCAPAAVTAPAAFAAGITFDAVIDAVDVPAATETLAARKVLRVRGQVTPPGTAFGLAAVAHDTQGNVYVGVEEDTTHPADHWYVRFSNVPTGIPFWVFVTVWPTAQPTWRVLKHLGMFIKPPRDCCDALLAAQGALAGQQQVKSVAAKGKGKKAGGTTGRRQTRGR